MWSCDCLQSLRCWKLFSSPCLLNPRLLLLRLHRLPLPRWCSGCRSCSPCEHPSLALLRCSDAQVPRGGGGAVFLFCRWRDGRAEAARSEGAGVFAAGHRVASFNAGQRAGSTGTGNVFLPVSRVTARQMGGKPPVSTVLTRAEPGADLAQAPQFVAEFKKEKRRKKNVKKNQNCMLRAVGAARLLCFQGRQPQHCGLGGLEGGEQLWCGAFDVGGFYPRYPGRNASAFHLWR